MTRGPTCYSDFQRRKLDREFGSPLHMFRSGKVSQGNVSFDLKNCGLLFLFQAKCLPKLLQIHEVSLWPLKWV